MSVNTVLIHKPKGEALGFKVPNTVREQVIDVVDFLESLDFKLTAFRVIENEAVKVEYTNDTGGFTQRFIMVPNGTVYQKNGLPVCWIKSIWESKGFYFDNSDEMFESADEIHALNVQEYDAVEALRGILEWCRSVGVGLENFGMGGEGIYSIMTDGYESEEFGRNDYVFQNEQGQFEVRTKENLESEGYTFQDGRPF
jgi:hypothetical protein